MRLVVIGTTAMVVVVVELSLSGLLEFWPQPIIIPKQARAQSKLRIIFLSNSSLNTNDIMGLAGFIVNFQEYCVENSCPFFYWLELFRQGGEKTF